MADFYKFPRTPHLSGSVVVDDDRTISIDDFNTLARDSNIVIQEKIDGTNVGIHFEKEWHPVLQKRGGIIETREKEQYNMFRNWVYERLELLWNIAGTDLCLFGEWLWTRHSVSYNKLPEYFIVFDIFEKESGQFLGYDQVLMKICEKLPVVLLLCQGAFKDIPDINSLIQQSKYGEEQAEGVYIRFEQGNYVTGRCKIRRETFSSGRDDFNSAIMTNTLKA